MYIRDLFRKKEPIMSFEIFPPKKTYPVESIYNTIELLQDLEPDFISVTYGAGGGSRDRTVDIASSIKNRFHMESLAHLTCVTSTREEIHTILDELHSKKVRNILALRGDIPRDRDFKFPTPLHYRYASDLIEHIYATGRFCIGGAAYPEGHPESPGRKQDLINLRNKVDKGVDFLITQLFFDNRFFYDFLDEIRKMGINIPVLAGIMPVLNKNQILRMISLCGASIPNGLAKLINKYQDDPESLREAGTEYAVEQISDLLGQGIDGFHLYTMNKPETAVRIVNSVNHFRKKPQGSGGSK